MTDNAAASINYELVGSLCLEAGRIMEDASAALAVPCDPGAIAALVDALHTAASEILALANAASALVRHITQPGVVRVLSEQRGRVRGRLLASPDAPQI